MKKLTQSDIEEFEKINLKDKISHVGVIKNDIQSTGSPYKFQDVKCKIIVKAKYAEGLYRIDENERITVIFLLHKQDSKVKLRHTNIHGEYKGVFATRTPSRPSSIAVSSVKLLNVKNNVLEVMGLDAIDGTPVLDIKPYSSKFDGTLSEEASGKAEALQQDKQGKQNRQIKGEKQEKQNQLPQQSRNNSIEEQISVQNPRKHIIEKILEDDKKALMRMAGQIHGHYCGGLALGIHLAVAGLKEIRKFTDGVMENLLAVVEMNNCAADGIQFVTGCTFGNNSLIFEDVGKNAVTFVIRDGKTVRVSVKKDWRDARSPQPELDTLFKKVVKNRNATPEEVEEFKKKSTEAAFELMEIPSQKIVDVNTVEYVAPERAPIHSDFICDKCGEKTMGSRKVVNDNGQVLCLKCANAQKYRFTGHGIEKF